MSELEPSVIAPAKPGLRKLHFIMCAGFTSIGLASWQGLVRSRHSGRRNLVGLFTLVCLICLFGATQSSALPVVYKSRDAQIGPLGATRELVAQHRGTYTDSRDHKVYQTVQIGNQVWFAENFSYLPSVNKEGISVYGYTGGSVSEAKATGSYQKYGALYTWEEAKTLAPEGWRLPTDADWQRLEKQIGIDPETVDTLGWRGKSREADSLKMGGSTGFDALFGGWRTSQGTFNFQGQHANFWVADSYDDQRAYERLLNYKNGNIGRDSGQKGCAFSVRYVRNP
jgi:uncharacterized protein (TIGR02145 family)